MATVEISEYSSVLEQSRLLAQIPPQKYPAVLKCLSAERKSCPKGSVLCRPAQQPLAGILLQGTAERTLLDEGGNQLLLGQLNAGDVFGIEHCCGGTAAETILRAVTDCEILVLHFAPLLGGQTLTCPYRMQVTANLLSALSCEVLFLNTKLRILGQKKLRDKLRIYLQTLPVSPAGVIVLPFNRRELADYLYADRSALSRELCKLRDEGILRFQGAKITVLRADFLEN